MHTFLWFQIFLANTNNFLTDLFDESLTNTAVSSQSGSGSNDNEWMT